MRVSEPCRRIIAGLFAAAGASACRYNLMRAGASRLIRLIRSAGRISGGVQADPDFRIMLKGVQGVRVQLPAVPADGARKGGVLLFELRELVRLPARCWQTANSTKQVRDRFGGWGIQVAEIGGKGRLISKFIFRNQTYGQTERNPLYSTGTDVNGRRRTCWLQ